MSRSQRKFRAARLLRPHLHLPQKLKLRITAVYDALAIRAFHSLLAIYRPPAIRRAAAASDPHRRRTHPVIDGHFFAFLDAPLAEIKNMPVDLPHRRIRVAAVV